MDYEIVSNIVIYYSAYQHNCTLWYSQNSGIGTNFCIGGPRCIGRGGPKQDYIIKSTKPEYTRYSILCSITWGQIIGGGGGRRGGQWPIIQQGPPRFLLHCRIGVRVLTRNQVVHNSIGWYETSSLHTATEMLSGSQVSKCIFRERSKWCSYLNLPHPNSVAIN